MHELACLLIYDVLLHSWAYLPFRASEMQEEECDRPLWLVALAYAPHQHLGVSVTRGILSYLVLPAPTAEP